MTFEALSQSWIYIYEAKYYPSVLQFSPFSSLPWNLTLNQLTTICIESFPLVSAVQLDRGPLIETSASQKEQRLDSLTFYFDKNPILSN